MAAKNAISFKNTLHTFSTRPLDTGPRQQEKAAGVRDPGAPEETGTALIQ